MARRTLTPDERAARAARLDLLAQAATDLENGRAADIDRAAAILTNYSRRNVALILAQCEERGRDIPAAVAGFHDWRKAGRTVRKGAKGLAIYRPRTRKDTETGEETRTGYAVTYVFDVADTDPIGDDSPDTLRELRAGE